MKKIFLTFGIIITIITNSYSQDIYIPNGTSGIGNSTVSGNIGVGTSTPVSRFTVSPGPVGTTTIGGKPFHLGVTAQTTSNRSGFVAYPTNDYLNFSPNNGLFVALFPYTENSNNNDLSWKAFKLMTMNNAPTPVLEEMFSVDKKGNSFFAGNTDVLGNLQVGYGIATSSSNITLGSVNPNVSPWLKNYIGFNLVHNHTTNMWDVNNNSTHGSSAIAVTNSRMKFISVPVGDLSGNSFSKNDMEKYIVMSLNSNSSAYNYSSVVVGTPTRDANLYVNGIIRSHEIEVTLGSWSDFVFADNYKLKPLEEVESYILENNHLPDVPSEKEVLEEGVKLGEINAILLQKIEELTLYIIEQNKRIKALEK